VHRLRREDLRMATLLDSLTSLATPAVGLIAQRLGESNAAVSRGLHASVASVLGGLATQTTDVRTAHRLFDLITSRENSTNVANDVTKLVDSTSPSATSKLGTSLLSILFPGRVGSVGELISRAAGFKNPASGASLLGMAAPLVLGVLGKRARDTGMNLGGMTNMLAGERDSILAAAPAGLATLLDTGPAARASYKEPVGGMLERERSPARSVVATPTQSNRWLWPLLGVAALLLIWLAVSRGRRPAVTALDTAVSTGNVALDTAASGTSAALATAGGAMSDVARELGAFGKKRLPGGSELNIPERGIESHLIAFIEDKSRPVNDTTWFNFDRLNFATGSATILRESEEQLNNIASVLRAYPNVNVKIGGYTDSTGDASSNRRLSQQRADAVRQTLVGKGIDARRMKAEGYGSQHAVGNNATDEGRAKNRRIALRVTKK
jgi:OOP family OmpA-OmpF porin